MCCVLTVLIIIYIDDTQRDGPFQICRWLTSQKWHHNLGRSVSYICDSNVLSKLRHYEAVCGTTKQVLAMCAEKKTKTNSTQL